MLASQAARCGLTGNPARGVFQTLSAGNIGQPGAPGTGEPADAVVGARPTVRPSHITPAATKATGPAVFRRRTNAPSLNDRTRPRIPHPTTDGAVPTTSGVDLRPGVGANVPPS